MKKFLSTAFTICFFCVKSLQAQTSAEPSGVYQELTLGVDPSQGVVTGYYEENYEPPNMPHLHCAFYLFGKKKGESYAIQAWSPTDKKSKITDGELSFFSANGQKPSVLLRLERLDRDCVSIRPNLVKGQGAFFDIKKSSAWTAVRIVANPKSPYYQAPDPSSPTRNSAKRGTVLTVTERRADWAQVQSDQKPKGWIRETDLFPADPSEARNEPAPTAAGKVPATPPKADPTPPAKKAELIAQPAPKIASEPEPKDALIQRLKSLSVQAFEMALQVLKNPALRDTLSSKRTRMEEEFNALVSQLNRIAPSAYSEESKDIFETFLDLQYAERAQPVVSLRLNQKILGLGK